MGLRCTVFGHKWGDAATERGREEEGSEVVTTTREVRTCRRCGAEDVLGTSKEVRSLESRTEQSPHEGETTTPERDLEGGEESSDPETDDGVILDEDSDDDGGRGPREWPDRPERDGDAHESDEPIPWPETARETDEELREERFVGADRQGADHFEPDQTGRAQSTETDENPQEDRGDRSQVAGEGRSPTASEERSSPGGVKRGGGGEIIEAGDADAEEAENVDEDQNGGGDQNEDAEAPATGSGQPHADGVDGPRAEPDRGAGEAGEIDEGGEAGEIDEGGEAGEIDEGGEAGEIDEGGETDEAHEAGESADVETMMGPDATQRPEDDAEVLETTEPNEQSQASAREPVDPTDHASGTDPDGTPPESDPSLDPSEPPSDDEPAPEDIEYYCPECDYVDDSRWPSRRAGDVCSDCRRSYLAQRQH